MRATPVTPTTPSKAKKEIQISGEVTLQRKLLCRQRVNNLSVSSTFEEVDSSFIHSVTKQASRFEEHKFDSDSKLEVLKMEGPKSHFRSTRTELSLAFLGVLLSFDPTSPVDFALA